MNHDLGKRLVALKRLIVPKFNTGHWHEVALLTGHSDIILNHSRLLRSLGFGDDDYEGNVIAVLRMIAAKDPSAIDAIERYAHELSGQSLEYISALPSERRITFAPNVFSIPDNPLEPDLASVMMPMAAEFSGVYSAIQRACARAGFRCLRADDIWEHTVIVQDIFSLVFRSQVVIVDFTTRNANVLYETGIAHTLGKHVVPISQSMNDVPFDLRHHRVLGYLANEQGLGELETQLSNRLRQLLMTPASASLPTALEEDDEVPF